MPIVFILLVQIQDGQQHGTEYIKEGMAAPTDAIIHLDNVESMECDVHDITRTPKLTNMRVSKRRVDIEVQTKIDSKPSGHLQRDHHHKRRNRSFSPSVYYKHSVRVHDLIDMDI